METVQEIENKLRIIKPYLQDEFGIDKILKYLDTVDGFKEFLENDMVTVVER